jgi:hypothetical protein
LVVEAEEAGVVDEVLTFSLSAGTAEV